jgi:hypothetical protein
MKNLFNNLLLNSRFVFQNAGAEQQKPTPEAPKTDEFTEFLDKQPPLEQVIAKAREKTNKVEHGGLTFVEGGKKFVKEGERYMAKQKRNQELKDKLAKSTDEALKKISGAGEPSPESKGTEKFGEKVALAAKKAEKAAAKPEILDAQIAKNKVDDLNKKTLSSLRVVPSDALSQAGINVNNIESSLNIITENALNYAANEPDPAKAQVFYNNLIETSTYVNQKAQAAKEAIRKGDFSVAQTYGTQIDNKLRWNYV